MYYSENELKTINNYLQKINFKKILSFGNSKKLAKSLYACITVKTNDLRSDVDKKNDLIKIIDPKGKNQISSIFSGSSIKALKLLMSNTSAKSMRDVWEHSSLYPYSMGWQRKPFRSTKNTMLYLEKNIMLLQEMVYKNAFGEIDIESELKRKKGTYCNSLLLQGLLSSEIDKGNENILNVARDIIYGENENGSVSRELIYGLLMSRNTEAHKMIGDLLLAAKLQEGLRQAIVESMDEGSREGYLYILKIIIDHNLLRFSSVVRALDTSTGLLLPLDKPLVIKKCFELAYDILTDKTLVSTYIDSDNNLEVFMALWATAFDEVLDIESLIINLVSSNQKYKKLIALYFLHQTFFPKIQNSISIRLLSEDDFEILGWCIKNLFYGITLNAYRFKKPDVSLFPDNCSPMDLYVLLKQVLLKLPKKKMIFNESVFPWYTLTLTASEVLEKMILCASLSNNSEIIDELLDYRDKMSVDVRHALIKRFLSYPKSQKQKAALVMALGDKSSSIRSTVMNILSGLLLKDSDFLIIENLFQYKYDDLQKNCITLMLNETPNKLFETITRLFASQQENKRLGAIELVSAIKNDNTFSLIYDKCEELMLSQTCNTQAEQLRTNEITNSSFPIYTAENGFGLYNPQILYSPKMLKENDIPNVAEFFALNVEIVKHFFSKLSALVHKHREYQYETISWNGSIIINVLGSQHFLAPLSYKKNTSIKGIDNYPLSNLWTSLVSEMKLNSEDLLALSYALSYDKAYSYQYSINAQGFLHKQVNIGYSDSVVLDIQSFFKDLPYLWHCRTILDSLIYDIPKKDKFFIASSASKYLFYSIPQTIQCKPIKNKINGKYFFNYNTKGCYFCDSTQVNYWLYHTKMSAQTEEEFEIYFNIAYSFYKSTNYKSGWYESSCTLYTADFGHAFGLGLIDENELLFELCGRPASPQHMKNLTNSNLYRYKETLPYQQLHEIAKKVINRITEIEILRGEMTTCVTHLVANINKCYGVEVFSSILLKMNKNSYVRGYIFTNSDSTKKHMFSHLLKCCYPTDKDNTAKLHELLDGKTVTPTQLIDATMYAPQWVDIVEEYLQWPGLKSAIWYFHAHINETFSNKKQTIVARYSSIEPVDFKDGAFDITWFWDAYNTLGEKRFGIIYNSAKYVASAGQHRRAQLFTDAVTGKLNLIHTENTIIEKRTKDYLLAYALIPIKDKHDTLHRYEFIHTYLKQSKQFGAQRQASEGTASRIALLNLAKNAGYHDVNRLMWQMETEKINNVANFLTQQNIDDVSIRIVFSNTGLAEIEIIKCGKQLKNIPSKLKKNEEVLKIKAVQKDLKQQYLRARASLETAMVSGDEFELGELVNLEKNPVISPLLSSLVFVFSDKHGYYKDGTLITFDGIMVELSKNEMIRIAHPSDLYRLGIWAKYQQDLFTKQIVQPFKQVFRELYTPNIDELQTLTHSERYAGHQVQPKKALALLKSRGWTAFYEEGLQKVNFKENIVVSLYALADWFSPGDIEAPTLETVTFFERKSLKSISIDKISPILFSEIMRDIDLVVSIAHAGGVDPEASLSTIEMRESLLGEMLRLLKTKNVELRKTHAFIKGALGEYTVHLGSGTVQKMATGSIFIIPIPSQHRGRLFIPFMDDDPKTAEIISKILMLAEDKKIKDPEILRQIQS